MHMIELDQFNCEEKYFLCEHSVKFDKTNLHDDIFTTHGIGLCFSSLYSSQQNGKSKRMLCTSYACIYTYFCYHIPYFFY
ncbi:hypothetical protein HanRHA438_Chr09g0394791 [Helianthus annuus]|nr:hypothetical protein HanHA300_Chr09g0314481 [Helianthus annuus]KAJ0542032.1 hypothetical protein HanHA89_Chr09g0335351 [Helianthus annuus]KAJ0707096.1 hypothetical protein HanLR1_Chr09g0314691 [Helianthus annuus]KAJ0753037.1 hypothetical protein HanPI659440_Chr09g0331261 [Helianthus annuus]KAJ0887780.1 hypothetical protein HanRHA438_Chr09g0394791 [Helianthus annuus]